jgi:hypothetical protein
MAERIGVAATTIPIATGIADSAAVRIMIVTAGAAKASEVTVDTVAATTGVDKF